MTAAGALSPDRPLSDPLADALIAARLCALDPGLKGMILRGGSALFDGVIEELRGRLPLAAPVRRMPVHIDDERLLGGIDLAPALAQGKVRRRAGLLAEADGGIVVVPMAERLSDATAGKLAAAMDDGAVAVDRGGAVACDRARFLTIALDEGIDPDERAPAALAERVAFWLDSSALRGRPDGPLLPVPNDKAGPPIAEPQLLERIVAAAALLGIGSVRACLFALKTCRASGPRKPVETRAALGTGGPRLA